MTGANGVNNKKEGENVQIRPKEANNYRDKTYGEGDYPSVRDCQSDAMMMLPPTGSLDGIKVSASSLSLPYAERRGKKPMD